MPIPKQNIEEGNEEFIERCMSDDTMQEYDEEQRLAICSLQLNDEERALEDIDTKPTQEMAKEEKNLDIMKNKDYRHIQKIEETEESYIIHFAKAHNEEMNAEETPQDIAKDLEEELTEDSPNVETYQRSNPNKEVRTFDVQDLELRMDGDKMQVAGYGAVFNSQSNDLGGFVEYIAPGAFEGRLNDDVRFLVNHDGLPLARTTNNTLRLSVDDKGLRYEADLANTSISRDLVELLKDGTVSQSSFAFTVEDDSWESRDGVNVRTINKVSRLYDVSSVTYPAYNEAGSYALRSMEQWQEEEQKKKLDESLEIEKKEGIKEENDLRNRSLAEMRLKVIKNK